MYIEAVIIIIISIIGNLHLHLVNVFYSFVSLIMARLFDLENSADVYEKISYAVSRKLFIRSCILLAILRVARVSM